MRRHLLLQMWAIFAILVGAGFGPAKAPQPEEKPSGDRQNRSFAERPPAVGEKLPEVTVYDADGKPFPLRKLKGSHTVLVFGCLT